MAFFRSSPWLYSLECSIFENICRLLFFYLHFFLRSFIFVRIIINVDIDRICEFNICMYLSKISSSWIEVWIFNFFLFFNILFVIILFYWFIIASIYMISRSSSFNLLLSSGSPILFQQVYPVFSIFIIINVYKTYFFTFFQWFFK